MGLARYEIHRQSTFFFGSPKIMSKLGLFTPGPALWLLDELFQLSKSVAALLFSSFSTSGLSLSPFPFPPLRTNERYKSASPPLPPLR